MAAARTAFAALVALGVAFQIGSITRASDASIDTTASWNGSSYIYSFGAPNTATYGQTFATPDSTNTFLDDFTFYLNVTGTLHTEAYVYAWNGDAITGPALFSTSSPLILTGSGSGFVPVTVDTGSVALSSGQEYVMFLTISQPADYAASNGTSSWGYYNSGGGFVFSNNGGDFAALTSPWVTYEGGLAFKADFSGAAMPSDVSATPLPASFSAGASVLTVLAAGAFIRRRRRVQA